MNKEDILLLIIIIFVFAAGFFLFFEPGSEISAKQNETKQMKIETLFEGTGEELSKSGDVLTVHYVGTLENGEKFDSSVDRGIPFQFTLGAGQVIQGWEEGMSNMKIGEKRKLTIPAELGYGSRSIGSIPANSTLIFEVELLEIN